MAPINPKAGRASVHKTVSRKKPIRKEPALDESDDDDELFGPQVSNSGAPFEVTDLQDIAERVGKEVDVFAETLDQFKEHLQNADTQREAALRMCTSYRDYATDEAKKLRKQLQVQHLQEMRDNFARRAQSALQSRRGSASTTKETDGGLRELKRWQSEADTWDLMCAIISARYPSDQHTAENQAKLRRIGKPHRYTSDEDQWQNFILSDDVARERHLILKWLEQAADHDSDEVKTLAEELEKKAGQKGSMWINGWMETRERIKGAKRMRFGNDGPVDVRRSDSTDLLVSSLDPDAPPRENRTLEKGDAISERSMWITCFEMLRRGKSWDEVCRWCLERNQGWKAVSMGAAAEKQSQMVTAGPAIGILFRKMCLVAARSDTADDFESATFGLLGGDYDSVRKVARNWNDHIFAHFNHVLIEQHQLHILRQHPLHLPHDFVRSHNLGANSADTQQTTLSNQQIVHSLERVSKLHKEAQSAEKLLQGSLIGNTFRELCLRVGTAVADAAWKEEPSAVIRPVKRSDPSGSREELVESAIRDDPDSLRIITHILLIVRAVDRVNFTESTADEFDNIIAGYIQLLRVAGKRDMTPLYASLMAEDRCISSLAQVIADEQDPKDSMDFIRLMQIYNIDAIAVIKGQYVYQLDRALASDGQKAAFSMLETTKEDLYPGRRIKLRGKQNTISSDEEALISGLSVFFLVEGHWTVTFEALASACGQLLVNGHFTAARALVEQLDFNDLSVSKSTGLVGQAINVMDPEQFHRASDSTRKAYQIEIMQRESQKYYDMTLLVAAVRALEKWRQVEHEYASKVPRPSSVPVKVKKVLEEVNSCMEPLLSGLLMDAKDEGEASTFAKIRALYFPEIILSYITVLCTAGHMVSRDELLTAMDLSTVIAGEEGRNGLSKAFLDAGRMRELVECFAETGKIMLKLNETGKPRRERKGGLGKTLGIWEIYG